MDNRVVDLEIRYSHLERQLNELNQVVFEQQKAITLLEQQLTALRGRVAAQDPTTENEKPPHY